MTLDLDFWNYKANYNDVKILEFYLTFDLICSVTHTTPEMNGFS